MCLEQVIVDQPIPKRLHHSNGNVFLSHAPRLTVAGPGLAVRVVVIPKVKVTDAPLGEPFRVLSRQGAEQASCRQTFTESYRDDRSTVPAIKAHAITLIMPTCRALLCHAARTDATGGSYR